MKFQIDRDILADAVGWAARALPARPSVPVLAGILLAAEADTLTLSTFDYEVSAKSSVPVDADEPGTVLVSGRLLAEIVKSLPSRPVNFSTDEKGGVEVTCGAAKFTLRTMPGDEYPALPAMPPDVGSVGADTFAAAIQRVATAAGRDDTLPVLTGILMILGRDTITLVTTDRYRLAVCEFPWTAARATLPGPVVVPARSLTELARSCGGAAEITLSLAESAADGGSGILGLDAGNRQTTTRLLGGEYPRYKALLPAEVDFTAVAELDVAAFAGAVKRVALVAERNTPVRLLFASEGLVIEAGAGDEATAEEIVDVKFDGEDLRVAFNPQYLLDGLGALDSDTAVLSFTTPTRPAVLTGKVDGPADYRYVLMPIRSAG